ncbi:MAG: hypothetical protein LC799_06670 [Actinobacteria bacterium]|nr:hypothetical protein [Actinomycetota bacterium]
MPAHAGRPVSAWKAGDRRGEAVDEGVAADRTELAGAKHAGDRRAAKALGNDLGVVVGLGEQVSA